MCIDCVLASPRITQVDPRHEPLPEVVLPQLISEPGSGNTLVPKKSQLRFIGEDRFAHIRTIVVS
jgi:hypothetical protein